MAYNTDNYTENYISTQFFDATISTRTTVESDGRKHMYHNVNFKDGLSMQGNEILPNDPTFPQGTDLSWEAVKIIIEIACSGSMKIIRNEFPDPENREISILNITAKIITQSESGVLLPQKDNICIHDITFNVFEGPEFYEKTVDLVEQKWETAKESLDSSKGTLLVKEIEVLQIFE